MMRGLYTATNSMLSRQVKLENISNNIANQSTTGYKRDDTVFRSFRDELLARTRNVMPTPAEVPRRTFAAPVGNLSHGVGVEEIPTIHRPGNLEETNRPWDFALTGDGFFTVQTEDGLRYTRDGHFGLDPENYLVDSRGSYVMGHDGPIQFEDRGELTLEGGRSLYLDGEFVDDLLLADIPLDGLVKEGYNYFNLLEGVEAEESEATSLQGFLEESNVDITREMTNMIRVRRSYEASQKVAQAYDQLLASGANEVGVLR